MLALGLKLLCSAQLLALSAGANVGDQCHLRDGNVGVCQPIRQCPSAIDDVKMGERPMNCGFEGRTPIVCCKENGGQNPTSNSPDMTTNTAPTPPPTTEIPGRKAAENCKSWFCDTSVAERTTAEPREFPHMAALGFGPREKISWSCGGSLISEKYVLTAAHCLSAPRIGQVNWVLLASEVTRSFAEDVPEGSRRGQTHPVIRRIRHPEYKPPSKYNDIALLEIGPALEPDALPMDTRELHPACLPVGFADADQTFTLPGWGRVGYGEDPSPHLRKLEFDILDSSICNETYGIDITATSRLRRGIDQTMICARAVVKEKDTCQGNSGGPLQVPFKDACMYEVWGVASFTKVCGIGLPAVFTRVSEYIPWIESIVWP